MTESEGYGLALRIADHRRQTGNPAIVMMLDIVDDVPPDSTERVQALRIFDVASEELWPVRSWRDYQEYDAARSATSATGG